ncbi:MAG TPA: hypothetical protein VGO92_11175 [Acidimicrobiales bacterium]|nr:hypothetical protein [Acidimicrobiales bacterium]
MSDDRTSDPGHEAVEHLQKAALEMIKATRAFLDLAEELVADPAPLMAITHLVADLAAKGRGQTAHPPPDEPGIQHIRVS